MKFKLLFCYCYSNMWNKASPIGSLQQLKNIMWTSIKCLTEQDKNEVYRIIDVPIGYLNSRISYILHCYVCYYCLQWRSHYVVTVLRSKIRTKSRNFIHSNSNFLSKIAKFNTQELWRFTVRKIKYLRNLMRIR